MARTVFKEALDRPTGWQRLVGRWIAPRLASQPEPPLSADRVGHYVVALQHRRAESAGAPIVRALIWSDIRSRQFRPECLSWYTQAVRRYPMDERSNFYVAGLAFRGVLSMLDDERDEVYGRILRPEWRDSPWWSKLELPRADLMQYVVGNLLREAAGHRLSDPQMELLESAVQSNLLDRETLWTASAALAASYRHARRGDAMARSVYRLVFERMSEDIDNARWLGELLLSDDAFDGMSVKVFEHLFEALSARGEWDEARHWAVAATRSFVRQGRVPSGSSRLLRVAAEAEPGRMEFAVAAARAIVARPEEHFADDDLEFVRDVWVRWGSEIGVRDEATFTGLVQYLSSENGVGDSVEGKSVAPVSGAVLVETGATVGTISWRRTDVREVAAA
jgi:hypothetical protein